MECAEAKKLVEENTTNTQPLSSVVLSSSSAKTTTETTPSISFFSKKLSNFAKQAGARDHLALFECLQQLSKYLQSIKSSSTSNQPTTTTTTTTTTNIDKQNDQQLYNKKTLFTLYLRPHLSDQNPSVREACFRAYRFGMRTVSDVTLSLSVSLHVFVMRALERTDGSSKSQGSITFNNKKATTPEARRKQTRAQQRSRPYLGERMQALKVIRTIVTLAPLHIPKCLIFGIDSVAREKGDSLRRICLETLRTIVVVNPKLVTTCGALSTLFDAILDPSLYETQSSANNTVGTMRMHESILLTLLHVANTEKGRTNLQKKNGSFGSVHSVHSNFRRLLSPLVDPDYPKGDSNSSKSNRSGEKRNHGNDEREQRWNLAANAAVVMMRTWTGIFLLANDQQGGLNAVFAMLVQPVPLVLRHTILHMLFQILCIAAPKSLESRTLGLNWSSAKFDGVNGTNMYGGSNGSNANDSSLDNGNRRRKSSHSDRRHQTNGSSGSGSGSSSSSKYHRAHTAPQPNTGSAASTGTTSTTTDPSLNRHEKYRQEHWNTLSDLLPGAWSPPPPSGAVIGTSSSGGIRRSNTVGGHNVLDNYAATVVLSLLHCGVIEPLVALGLGIDESRGWYNDVLENDNGVGMSRPATRVLSLLLQTSERLLPRDVSTQVFMELRNVISAASHRNRSGNTTLHHAGIEENCRRGLPTRRQYSAEGTDYSERANAMLRHLNRSTGLGCFFGSDVCGSTSSTSNHAAEMLVPIDILSGGGGVTKATGAIGFSHLKLARSLKSQMENHRIDKSSLTESLKQSKVTMTKEPNEWDWKRISTLLDGPLAYNPSALWEVVRNTKFMKRLGGFFRCDPGEKGYFGHLPWTPRNCARYVRIVGQMLNILLSTNEQGGAMYVSEASSNSPSSYNSRNRGSSGNNFDVDSPTKANHSSDSPYRPGGERDTAGLIFLRTDRRGQLILEIVTHLHSIIKYIDENKKGIQGNAGKANNKSNTPKRSRMRLNRVGMFSIKREGDSSAGTPSSSIPNDGTCV